MRVKVIKIHATLEPETFGDKDRPITCYSWDADLEFNSKVHDHCRLRAFSKKVLWAGAPNAIVECDNPKDYKGMSEVKIITPSDKNNKVNSEPVFDDGRPAIKGQPELPLRSQPTGNYTAEEFGDLFRAAAEHAVGLVAIMETDARKATVQDICALTATYLIGAQKAGIRLTKNGKMNDKMKAELMHTINEALAVSGLADATVSAGLTDDDLIKFWIECDANATKFCVFVQKHIG